MYILQVAALATLSLISISEQVTALSTVQDNYLNVYPAFWNSFSIINLLLIPELMILQQCFHQQGSAYPFLQPRVKTFLTYILAAAAFGLQSHIWGYHKKQAFLVLCQPRNRC